MAKITLTLTDTEARALAALETIDGKTPDERFAPYIRDIVQNAAGIDLTQRPERVEARLVELEQDAAEAKAEREKRVAETPKEEPVVIDAE